MTPRGDHGGGMTPSQSAWDPSSATPSHVPDFGVDFDSPSPAYGTPGNPATPGFQGDSGSPTPGPNTPGPYTPGSAYSPYQPTPSPQGYGGSVPSPSPGTYVATPSPQGYQSAASPVGYRATPSPISYSPMTPGAPYTPATPGAAMDQGAGDWMTTEIEVRIRETHDDAGVVGLHGIVRSVSGSLCSVFVRDEDKTVTVACEHLEPVAPQRKDRVKVIFGEDAREQVGVLISVEEDEGVVKLDSGELKMLMLSHLCRMPYEDGQNPNARRAASVMSGAEADDDDDD